MFSELEGSNATGRQPGICASCVIMCWSGYDDRNGSSPTTAPVPDPGRDRTNTGQLRAYARDERTWGGSDPPMVAYVYSGDRKAERPEAHAGRHAGILQVDGYGAYTALVKRR